ncbi:hypothetical protein MRX96_053928, partial [Rhipicephalus microplus]
EHCNERKAKEDHCSRRHRGALRGTRLASRASHLSDPISHEWSGTPLALVLAPPPQLHLGGGGCRPPLVLTLLFLRKIADIRHARESP